jgi:hypothetical protein
MKTVIRLGASICVVVLSMAAPRAAFADCASGGAAFAKMARAGRLAQAPPRAHDSGDWDGPDFDHRASIVGLWQVTLVADDTVIDVGFDAWHADGTETLNDASPVSHNVCLGVWQQTGRRTYQLKHPAFRYDAAGNVIGTLVLRETNVVNRAGDRFSGDFTIQFFDPAGAMIFEGAGQITGERVTVD